MRAKRTYWGGVNASCCALFDYTSTMITHNREGEPALRDEDEAGAFKFAVGPSAKCDAKRLMIQVRKRATASSFKSSGCVER